MDSVYTVRFPFLGCRTPCMAKRSFWPSYGPLLIIGGGALLLAGTVVAAAASVGFGATILPIEQTDRGLRLGLFRTHWCGNGRLEYREQCDDGNRVNGDGCSRWCRVEPSLCAGRAQGERFPSPDGCNICACNRNGIACTMRACAPQSSSSARSSRTSSPAASQKCLSSNQCSRGQYCTTEDGTCESACEPGAVVCIQACAGRCRSTQCRPYVCPDGYTAPSCTEDGHVINYFADPCLTHQSSSKAAARSRARVACRCLSHA